MGGLDDVRRTLLALPGTEEVPGRNGHTYFRTSGTIFTWITEDERKAMVKAMRAEQAALVAEAPEVYEPGYSSGRFGWVVVHLEKVDEGELAELLNEAWRLTYRPPRQR
ncbi:MmcQ/YjbR family DNA-binding protein [Spirillospora sp. NPDC048911]|uniref:MmcQ/YjbR family DNA-binding protein n=1 Tax=Spirillospora sp. NPDC048911 TaxID=3364527 RepID=UPI003713E376